MRGNLNKASLGLDACFFVVICWCVCRCVFVLAPHCGDGGHDSHRVTSSQRGGRCHRAGILEQLERTVPSIACEQRPKKSATSPGRKIINF